MTDIKITDRFILIENCDDEEIIINDNKDFDDPTVSEDITEFKNKILLVKNCTNLKSIKADALNLTGLVIDKCSALEHLSVYNNRIKALKLDGLKNLKFVDINHNQVLENIYLRKCESLQELYVSNNKLKELDLTDNNKLRILYCSYNKALVKLALKHLKELKNLHCENCSLTELDCSNLEKLTDLSCFDNNLFEKDGKISGLTKLNLDNCLSLEVLDCAENRLEELTLNNHPKLWNVSCKTNVLKSLTINNCPSLKNLIFSRQAIIEWEWNFSKFKACGINNSAELLKALGIKISINSLKTRGINNSAELLKALGVNNSDKMLKILEANNSLKSTIFVNLGNIETKISIDKSSYSNLEKISFTEGASYFNPKGNPISYKDFPNLKEYGLGTANDPAFEEYLDKKREEEQRKNNFHQRDEGHRSDSKTISASNYKIPERKDEITNHDLSQWNLTGKLVIDGWTNLKSLNVGNNELNALVVSNCPKLKRLIYSHNKMPNEAEISGCDNLTTILNENYNGKVAWREELSEEEKTRLENLKKTEEYNDQVYVIFQREEQGESIDIDELTQIVNEIDINLIDQEYKSKLLTLYNDKLKEKFPQFYKKQPQEKNNKPDLKKLYHDLLKKIKKGEITINNKNEITNSLLSKEKKQELYKLLAKQSTSQEKQPTNHSFIISICSLLSVGMIIILFINVISTKIKKMFKKVINSSCF